MSKHAFVSKGNLGGQVPTSTCSPKKDDPETRFTLLLPSSDLWRGKPIQFLEGEIGGIPPAGPHFMYYIQTEKK